MPPKKEGNKLSDEQIKIAELKQQIEEKYNYVKQFDKNIPPIRQYRSGKIDTLKGNLKRLEDLKNKYVSEQIINRIGILYNEFKKRGNLLPKH